MTPRLGCQSGTHPEDDVVAEHQVFVATADLSVLIAVVVHLRTHAQAHTHALRQHSESERVGVKGNVLATL